MRRGGTQVARAQPAAYLDDAAPARGRPHGLQQSRVRVLAAAPGEDHPAPPATGRAGRDAVRRSVAVSVSIAFRHVGEGREIPGEKSINSSALTPIKLHPVPFKG